MSTKDRSSRGAEADREPERSSYADTILTNATVYTEDAAQPRASGVAIQGKAIIDVIRDETTAWRRLVGPETKVFDLGGRAVIPGLIDSHTHPGRVAVTKWRLVLPWTRDLRRSSRSSSSTRNPIPHLRCHSSMASTTQPTWTGVPTDQPRSRSMRAYRTVRCSSRTSLATRPLSIRERSSSWAWTQIPHCRSIRTIQPRGSFEEATEERRQAGSSSTPGSTSPTPCTTRSVGDRLLT
jgi:hypothetical protein